MAVPHYKYLVLKMPTEKGVLTLRGNIFVAYTYEEDIFRIAEAHDLSLRMAAMKMEAKKTPPTSWKFQSLKHHASLSSPRSIRRSSWSRVTPARRH
jgi:hypothetical protein